MVNRGDLESLVVQTEVKLIVTVLTTDIETSACGESNLVRAGVCFLQQHLPLLCGQSHWKTGHWQTEVAPKFSRVTLTSPDLPRSQALLETPSGEQRGFPVTQVPNLRVADVPQS